MASLILLYFFMIEMCPTRCLLSNTLLVLPIFYRVRDVGAKTIKIESFCNSHNLHLIVGTMQGFQLDHFGLHIYQKR